MEKMEGLSSWVPQENGSNGILELRGRRRWSQISIWGSIREACKWGSEEREEDESLSWVGGVVEVAGT